jgi:hypothetical protein
MSLSQAIRLLAQRPRIITGSVTGAWNTGFATSTLAGADLFAYGVANQWWRLQEAYIKLFPGVWNIATTITVRAYAYIMGTEQEIGNADWLADGTDGSIIYVYWFWLAAEMYGPLRVEVYSDNPLDDGIAAPYEYRIKDF